ncbi:DNA replication/repair protein RecF [Gammaproteobacteria bacterium LSUCC0112]|nr:DNA replication/repair protein RecF [Gammaproteobacteria bacterium LSUCC0112]
MAIITRLKVDNFRNLKGVDLELNPRFNLFFGENGSGKTSLLEAIHVLSVGKSFRTSKVEPLLAEDAAEFLVYSELDTGSRIGLLRASSDQPILRLNADSQSSWKEVASLMPLQVINSDIFLLIDGGASIRRRFLDWALFHVEHSYLFWWRNYRRLIQQRNALLKQNPFDLQNQLNVWDAEISKAGEEIHHHRNTLLAEYQPFLETTIETLMPDAKMKVDVEYRKGWPEGVCLYQALVQSRDKDARFKATTYGPHRADLVITCRKKSISEIFSRGQIKLISCALKISMGKFLVDKKIQQGVQDYSTSFLIDDLASELDQSGCKSIIGELNRTNNQCLFTSISHDALPFLSELTGASGKFHVEHGKITADKPAV